MVIKKGLLMKTRIEWLKEALSLNEMNLITQDQAYNDFDSYLDKKNKPLKALRLTINPSYILKSLCGVEYEEGFQSWLKREGLKAFEGGYFNVAELEGYIEYKNHIRFSVKVNNIACT